MDEYMEANRRHWDELVPVHRRSAHYDVAGFKAGRETLRSIEVEEVGDVGGKTLLHLQCHFGLDTLSWARRGAVVTGADFSAPAIAAARELATEVGIAAKFVESDVYSLPDKLGGVFDIVFTSFGTYFWLPDLERWAGVIAHFLRPGGTFYIADFHPIAGIFDDKADAGELRIAYPYFPTGEPLQFDEDGSYADREAHLEHRSTYSWPHPLGEIVSALAGAGLRIEFLHEFPYTIEPWFPGMERGDDGYYRSAQNPLSLPLMFSLRAVKRAG